MSTYVITDICHDCQTILCDLLDRGYASGEVKPLSVDVHGDTSIVHLQYDLWDSDGLVRWSDGTTVTCDIQMSCPTARVFPILKGHTSGAYVKDMEERRLHTVVTPKRRSLSLAHVVNALRGVQCE